jgi:hypothetical protein
METFFYCFCGVYAAVTIPLVIWLGLHVRRRIFLNEH